ncbi:acyltransferase [Candidatus Microgenomates bacterium]|nr:acyltransferase [Candidatus Microgenomates bacterium]
MKDRLPALDGLRGFAAFGVLLSHIGYSPEAFISFPFLIDAYRVISVGPNSVQILFVLSGFLMALLYPTVPSAIGFIRKRYARIMPLYTAIIIFLWLTMLVYEKTAWYIELALLAAIAGMIHLFGILIARTKKLPLAKILFGGFIVLQSIVVIVNLIITPRLVQNGFFLHPSVQKDIIVMLSNLTMTTSLVKGIENLSGVLWSLAPEILFYLVYPFVGTPIVQAGKKYGSLVGLILLVGSIKILFDLDSAFISIGSLQSMNIARASGFAVGVAAGSIYQMRSRLWLSIERQSLKPAINLFPLVLLIAIQWGDLAIRDGHSITYMNWYYLISSFCIACVVLSGVIQGTIINKIFSSKLLTFLGLISYSLYLVHLQTIEWARSILMKKNEVYSTLFSETIFLVVAVFISIGVAYGLYNLIESLYFKNKKHKTVPTKPLVKSKVGVSIATYSRTRAFITGGTTILVFVAIYAGAYSPTFLLARHTIDKSWRFFPREISLVKNNMHVPFTALDNNLSVVTFDLRYEKDKWNRDTTKKPAQLIFKLSDQHGKTLFTSKRSAFEIEGQPRFSFGLPTISDSMRKHYTAELFMRSDGHERIFVDTVSTSMVTTYTASKSDVLRNPMRHIINRFMFLISNQGFVFVILYIGFVFVLNKKNRMAYRK